MSDVLFRRSDPLYLHPRPEDQILESCFHRGCPNRLFHYTRQSSFLSILESQVLWFTDIQYFNDSQEYRYALEMATDIIDSIACNDRSELRRQLARSVLHSLRRSKLHSYFVFCLSQNGDLLSQWRSYASPGTGYAAGFDSMYLRALAAESNGILGRCIYKPTDQRNFIETFIEVFFQDLSSYFPYFKRGEINGDLFNAKRTRFMSLFLRYAPFIKNASFEEESEWRIVIPAKTFKQSDLRFRDGRMTLIPYVSVSHSEYEIRRHIKAVIIKSSPHQDLAVLAVQRYFEANGIDDIEIRSSAIPYREGM
jgi:hypothetical protein